MEPYEAACQEDVHRLKAILESADAIEALYFLHRRWIRSTGDEQREPCASYLSAGLLKGIRGHLYVGDAHSRVRTARPPRIEIGYRLPACRRQAPPVYGINTKFHGALFQRVRELVG